MSNQNKLGEIFIILNRKILAAILGSLLAAFIISIPYRFEGDLFFNMFYLNLMFTITYGVIVSIIGDWVSRQISEKLYIREIISFLFHFCGGLPLNGVGLIPAILFFIVDRLLKKAKIGCLPVMIALLMVVLMFIILLNSWTE